jgi:hypothetical protein
MSDVAGANAHIFAQMTRETIVRKIERLSTEELLDLLGHLILKERQKSAENSGVARQVIT